MDAEQQSREPRPVSCHFCRRRKLRCSRQFPCDNCSVRSITCQLYDPSDAPAASRVTKKRRLDLSRDLPSDAAVHLPSSKHDHRATASNGLFTEAYTYLTPSMSTKVRHGDANNDAAWLEGQNMDQSCEVSLFL